MGATLNISGVDPPNEAVRRILLCIHAMGGVSRVVEWLDVPRNTLSRYLYGREPTLRSAVQIRGRSKGLIAETHWLEPPRGTWPPRDPRQAYRSLLRS